MTPQAGCGAAIHDAKGRLLLLQRLKAPEAGAWGLPGGKVDFGEPVKAAVMREIKEELGVEIALTGLACLTEIIDKGDGRHWVSPVYRAQIVSGTPKLMEPDKHGGLGWFDLSQMPEVLTTPTLQYLSSRALNSSATKSET